jgi:hypothetical protein
LDHNSRADCLAAEHFHRQKYGVQTSASEYATGSETGARSQLEEMSKKSERRRKHFCTWF